MHRTIERIRSEFLEMPGLRLTAAQVERLLGVEQTTCRAVLDTLVGAKFLRLSADGIYRLLDDNMSRTRPAGVANPPLRDEGRRNIA